MKPSLPLCTLALIAVGLTMVRADCNIEALTCFTTFSTGAVSSRGNKDATCALLRAFKKCESNACPSGTSSYSQRVLDSVKQLGFDCSHASHLVSAQTMPVLLLFIIGLFFGVF